MPKVEETRASYNINICIVLQNFSLAPFEPLEEVPAKFLTLNALFVLAITSLKRIGDLKAL